MGQRAPGGVGTQCPGSRLSQFQPQSGPWLGPLFSPDLLGACVWSPVSRGPTAWAGLTESLWAAFPRPPPPLLPPPQQGVPHSPPRGTESDSTLTLKTGSASSPKRYECRLAGEGFPGLEALPGHVGVWPSARGAGEPEEAAVGHQGQSGPVGWLGWHRCRGWTGGVSLRQGQSGDWLAGQQEARGLEAGPWGPMPPQ